MSRAVPIAAALLAMTCPALAQAQSTAAARTAAFAKLPDWNGLWIPEGDETSIGGLPQSSLDAKETGKAAAKNTGMQLYGFGAPWNAEGKRRQAERRGNGNRKADGWGFPMLMNAAPPIQFFITPEKVLILNGYRDVTDVRVGEPHPSDDDLWPTVWGDSVGHWEGDTLVIDTIQVKDPNEYFHGAPPLSEDAHYLQRIRLDAPGHLIDDMTITDPTTLTQPWTVHLSFVPADKDFGRMVYDIYDNDRTDSDNGTIAPPKDEQQPAGK